MALRNENRNPEVDRLVQRAVAGALVLLALALLSAVAGLLL